MSEPVTTLEAWLSIATDKLTQAGKERITLEITSHFDDAVASYRANGLTHADAQAGALADLGNAQKAARRFRKRHLTQSESDFLERRLNDFRKWRKPWTQPDFWIVLGWLAFIVLLAQRWVHVSLVLLLIGSLLYVAQSFSLSLANRRGFRSFLRCMLALDILTWVGMFMYFGCSKAGWLPAGTILLMASWKWFPEFRLWFKLGKLADAGQEMRPPDAIAS